MNWQLASIKLWMTDKKNDVMSDRWLLEKAKQAKELTIKSAVLVKKHSVKTAKATKTGYQAFKAELTKKEETL